MRLLSMKKTWTSNLIVLLLFGIIGCTAVDDDTDTDTTGTFGAAVLAVSADTFSIESNDEDYAQITATVLDTNNGSLEGVTVVFSCDSGRLSSSTATTDANGNATVQLRSGSIDKSNRNITVTGQVTGVDSSSTVVQVTGTTVTPSVGKTSLDGDSGETTTLTVDVDDSNGDPIANTDVVVTINGTKSSGTVTFVTSAQGTTGSDGIFEVTLAGAQQGDVVLTITAAGASVDTDDYEQTINVTGAATGGSFRISSPTSDPASLTTGSTLTITVEAPSQSQVLFSTSLGTFTENGSSVYTATVNSGTASATLSSTSAGVATVQAANADGLSPSDTITVGIAAPASSAAAISLQGSASVVAPSAGDVENSITLTATVTNSGDEPVGDAYVAFSIANPTGGGEYISPVVKSTNAQGVATTTFTSGLLSSDPTGVMVTAQVVGTAISDTFQVVIGGTAGSIMIGRGTSISSVDSDTAYSQPMTVVVADANGNPVTGADVSLSVWPARYYDGYWYDTGDEVIARYTAGAQNEDVNRNVRLDTLEDDIQLGAWTCMSGTYGNWPFIYTSSGDINGGNGDDLLTPPNSAAGSLPTTVTTDEYGKASFELVYAKASAAWVVVEVTASTTVLGTETLSTLNMTLPYIESDAEHLDNSPFDLLEPLQLEVLATQDVDGDGYLVDTWSDGCVNPGTAGDCDDTDPDVYPGNGCP